MSKHTWYFAALAGCVLFVHLAGASPLKLESPDGSIAIMFELKRQSGKENCPCYRVEFKGAPVIADSRLGLELQNGPLHSDLKVTGSRQSVVDSSWKPVCGERSVVRDHYRQLVLDLEEVEVPHRRLQISFRAYNEGVAFAYTLPEQEALKGFTIRAETTQFRFTQDHTTWVVYRAQGYYDGADERQDKRRPGGEVKLSQVQPGAERPLTVRVATNLYAAIAEAKLVNYARMKLRPAAEQPYTLEAYLDAERNVSGTVQGTTPFTSPWRVVMIAESAGMLLQQNDILLNLNDPCALADTSWIKPGKVIRESSLSTAGGKACVDFAVGQGLQFIEYDAGWYGNEYDPKSDARRVRLDPKRNPNPDALNLREVIEYGNAKGIGVILYVNHLALEQQIDELLPLYQSWGVQGVKYGFVNVGSQRWTRWLHEAIRKAAEHRLMVDIHDEYRSTGYQRTYPNLMTVEGIAGNETFPTPVHNATLPFTRFLTGPADYTFCWYNRRLQPTHAHQLAISTIFFSPWQFLFWYDLPSSYQGEKELQYWKELPTTWDETRVITGEIGKEVSLARRRGSQWFVGAINPGGREFTDIPLGMLGRGTYTATIYSDLNPDDPKAKDVKIQTRAVTASTVLKLRIPSNGGVAIQLTPEQR